VQSIVDLERCGQGEKWWLDKVKAKSPRVGSRCKVVKALGMGI
jgi:hypothetical protein